MSIDNNTVLSPLEVAEFFSTAWEQSFHHIARNNADYFANLISVESIETYLATNDAFFPSVQVVHNERDISRFDYTDDTQRIIQRALAQHYRNGATLIISEAHKHFSSLATLCRQFTQSVQMRCQTNLYLSPPGNQGFRSHYDTHEVFILQVQGSKTFRFYESDIALPFPDDRYDPEQNRHTEITHEVLLNAGDTLYIPRGLVHDAVAQSAEPSLHVTLGVFPVVVRDVLQSAIHIAAERNVDLRRAQVPGRSEAGVTQDELIRLVSSSLTPEIISEARARALDDIAFEVTPDCESLLTPIALQAKSSVSINHSAVLGAEFEGDTYKLRLFGQVMSFNQPMASAVEHLVNNAQVKVSELPNLDQEQRLALCQHLVEANALKMNL